jgi:hypothetical protein
MTGNNEYDAIGELFRRRLENHRMPVDSNGWDEIERRMGRRKNKSVIWLWIAGTAAAAATIAVLLTVRPATNEMIAAMDAEESVPAHHEVAPTIVAQDLTDTAQADAFNTADEPVKIVYQRTGTDNSDNDADVVATNIAALSEPYEEENHSVTRLLSDSDTHLLSDSVAQSLIRSVAQLLNDLDIEEEDDAATKDRSKWLLAAAFGTGGYTDESFNNSVFNSSADLTPSKSSIVGNNDYATNLSYNIRSFNGMYKDEFTNIRHRPPVSFGVMARKHLGKHGGVESGLVYTYLASQFEWSGYDVHQGLHYMGVPVNMFVYLGNNAKSNWRVYLSGGFTVEKNLRAVFRQENRWSDGVRTTIVKSTIDRLQWSLNGALGLSYKLEKGWGIYFEPRVGYSFDCGQPISIRTEWPVYVGINLGLNYEL